MIKTPQFMLLFATPTALSFASVTDNTVIGGPYLPDTALLVIDQAAHPDLPFVTERGISLDEESAERLRNWNEHATQSGVELIVICDDTQSRGIRHLRTIIPGMLIETPQGKAARGFVVEAMSFTDHDLREIGATLGYGAI